MNKSVLKYSVLGFFALLVLNSCKTASDAIELKSPDTVKKITFYQSKKEEGVQFSIKYRNQEVLLPSILELISNELNFKGKYTILKVEKSTVNDSWQTRFSELSMVPNHYNQFKIFLKLSETQLNVIARAYNEGIAFSYEIPKQQKLSAIGLSENIYYNFKEDYPVWSTPKREKSMLTAQGKYRKIPITQLEEGSERPLVIEINDKLKIALVEAQLVDYARLSFNKSSASKYSILSSLDGTLGKEKQDTITGAIISERKNEGNKVYKKLPFQSPWRVVMMGESMGELLEKNYIIQNLNEPSQIADESWIKPGKVLRETTLTTQGGLAAIDFVASHNMQYVLFDAGWYGNEMSEASDATTVTLDPKRSKGPFEIETITKYAKEKGVGIILYVNRRALEKQLDEILPLYKKWGVAGIKYGFVRVGDQDATNWLHEAVKKAAQYGMILDVHDEYRPTGFSRTYPNLLSQEGIRGDEETVPNEHTLISMFTRMLAGAADNTVCYYSPKVNAMGSHASQLAKTVCVFSPLQHLYWYDKPAASPEKLDGLWGDTKHIGNEPELEFFNNVPTTWDETKVLVDKIGELGVIARRKGNDWFIGGINGKTESNVTIDFSFLNENESFQSKIYTDDETVQTRTHVKIEEKELTKASKLNLTLKSNNGFVMRLTKK